MSQSESAQFSAEFLFFFKAEKPVIYIADPLLIVSETAVINDDDFHVL